MFSTLSKTEIIIFVTFKLPSTNAFNLVWSKIWLCGNVLKYLDPEDRIFNYVISDIPVVLRETTLTISDSFDTGSPVKFEIVRVVYLSVTKISEITQLKNRSSGSEYLHEPIVTCSAARTMHQ